MNISDSAVVKKAFSIDDKHWISDDLGYRPSDLLQANSIIWVEGPSDRIYLKSWISEINNELIEGVDYAIMFYGGGLVSHLTLLDDSDADELIRIMNINRFSAIIIDSDKTGPKKRISVTKRRILAEADCENKLCRITKGRTIENYVDGESLLRAVRKIHTRMSVGSLAVDRNEFSAPFDVIKTNGEFISQSNWSPSKVSIAREVTKGGSDFSLLDLRERVDDIISFIERARRHYQPSSNRRFT